MNSESEKAMKEKQGKRKPQILIADDVPSNLKLLCDSLEPEGYEIIGVPNGKTALEIANRVVPDVILLDIMMPDVDGYTVCQTLKANEATKNIPVLFVTMKDDKPSVVKGLSTGGVDYITKPFSKEEVVARVKTHLEIGQLTRELLEKNRALEEANEQLRTEVERRQTAEDRLDHISQQENQHWGIHNIIGKSQTIGNILSDIRKLQNAETTTVLITGESGTGKELIARAIHTGSGRATGQFIPVNCSAIPAELAESTLFGHIRGAFTGASQSRKGVFELANGGTLFLDEIGDMPLPLQAKLLRVLEEKRIQPVGGEREKVVDARVIAATNMQLERRIAESDFRRDLYFRLMGSIVHVPPLRERMEDIPLLIEHFLAMFKEEMRLKQKPQISSTAQRLLEKYPFPGNVRELKNIIEHALIKSSGTLIKPEHLHLTNIDSLETPRSREQNKGFVLMVKRALFQTEGEPEAAAELLNISPAEVYPFLSETDIIQTYVKEEGSITNAECSRLLGVDRHRARYLLKQMCSGNLLVQVGANRGARYYPS